MRIFLAIPDDLAALRPVIDQLVASRRSEEGELSLVGWSERGSVAPDPDQDLMLALGWLALDPQGSGSEATLQASREAWRGSDRGAWLLYRCTRLPERLDDIDGGSLDRLRGLFQRLRSEGGGDVVVREFESEEELARKLGEDLDGLLAKAERRAAEQEKEEAVRKPGTLETWLHPGEAYEMTFLSVGAVDLAQVGGAGEEELATVQQSLRRLVESTSRSYGGSVIRWKGEEGLVAFWRKRRRDSAVMAGLKVLHNMPVFNLDLEQNPLGEPIHIRMAVHDTAIVFRLPVDQIASDGIDTVIGLQRKGTPPDELSVTKSLIDRLDPRLRSRFRPRERFEQEPVFGCRLPSVELKPEQATLQELSEQFERRVQAATGLLDALSDQSDRGLVTAAVDGAYSTLNRFCAGFGRWDPSWSASFVAELQRTTAQLSRRESELWTRLRSAGQGSEGQLEAAVKAAARRRARVVAILGKLEERIQPRAPGEPETPALDERVLDKIESLLRADALDSEPLLTDLLINRRSGLVEFLSVHRDDERHGPLRDKLWSAADLLVLDDLYAIRGHRRSGDPGILNVVARPPVSDPRFLLVERLLAAETVDLANDARRALGGEVSSEDHQILNRCLVLGHPDTAVRVNAAADLDQGSIWQTLSLPNVPLAALHTLGERIHAQGDENAKKIFFDCVRAPIGEAIEAARDREQIDGLASLILLMIEYPFLVEGGYFERFNALLQALLVRARESGVHLEYFESLRETLEKARREEGKPGRLPSGIRKLPLTLQRRLASDPIYLLWFVTHPDARIAGETIRHIGLRNVERVLRLKEINGSVMQSVLRRPELFTRTETLLAALSHPKCEQRFASHHLPGLARTRQGRKSLEQIARNPSANPTIRALARRATSGRRRG